MSNNPESEKLKQPCQQNEPSSTHDPAIVVQFDQLAKGKREVLICHNEQTYRLLVTKNGKLILNK